MVDKVTSAETKVSEMETTVEDLQWDIEKLRNREQKLNKHLAEAMEQVCLHVFKMHFSAAISTVSLCTLYECSKTLGFWVPKFDLEVGQLVHCKDSEPGWNPG